MEYQTAVTTEFIPRMTAALNGLRSSLITAGIAANRITVGEVESTDLRYRLNVTVGPRTVIVYIELTDTLRLGATVGEAKAVLTLWVEGNGTEITHAYTPGVPQQYTSESGIDELLTKLTAIESTFPEVTTKVRAFLGV